MALGNVLHRQIKRKFPKRTEISFQHNFSVKDLAALPLISKTTGNEVFLVFFKFTLIATADIYGQIYKIYNLQQICICKLGVEPISSKL